MNLSDVKSDRDFDEYLAEKELESYEEVSEDMYLGECVDENGDVTDPDMWYWRGCSPQMNDPDIKDKSYSKAFLKKRRKA